MAKENFFIGIGGTGSRVAEALIFLSAAGFGPERLSIIIVDPDRGNGNLDRTTALIARYGRCRKEVTRLRKEKSDFCLFGTDLKVEDPERVVWTVFDKQVARRAETTTLESIFSFQNLCEQDRSAADLVELLYTPEELGMILTEGFRGHPSIGAAVMAQPPESDSAFKPLWESIRADRPANDIGVFLVGSVFGGTGAAGMPTFASEEVIKKADGAVVAGGNKVTLGGALVLPYFSFKVDEGAEKRETTFMTPDKFAQATRAALTYYASEDKLAFDELFLVGDSLGQEVGKFSTGKGDQRNNPHYIEVVTALAALDFFRANGTRKPEDQIQQKVFISQRSGEKVVEWDSFPVTRDTSRSSVLRKEFREKLIAMTVFSYSVASYGAKVLDSGQSKEPTYQSPYWLKEGFKSKDGPRDNDNPEILENFRAFAGLHLQWLADMCSVDEQTTRLFNSSHFTEDKLRDWQKDETAIGSLVSTKQLKGLTIGDYQKDFLNNTEYVTEMKHLAAVSAAEKFVFLFSRAAEKFTGKNYGGQ